MKLTVEEKDLLKKMAHDFFDQDVPALVDAEEKRIPEMYQGMVKMVVSAMLPAFIKSMDDKIDSLLKEGA